MARITAAVVGIALLAAPAVPARDEREEPDRVTVQHVLVAFEGSLKGKPITRSRDEAEERAGEILELARGGEDFAALVKAYTDDRFPGIYKLCNKGVKPAPGEMRRYDLVTYFGNVAFELEVGEIGMTDYHATRSPFGYHVIKRLE